MNEPLKLTRSPGACGFEFAAVREAYLRAGPECVECGCRESLHDERDDHEFRAC